MSTRATTHYIIAVGPHWSKARPSGPAPAAWTAGLVRPRRAERWRWACGLAGPTGVQAVARPQLPPAEEGRVSPVLPTARLLEDPQDRGLPGFLTNTLLAGRGHGTRGRGWRRGSCPGRSPFHPQSLAGCLIMVSAD